MLFRLGGPVSGIVNSGARAGIERDVSLSGMLGDAIDCVNGSREGVEGNFSLSGLGGMKGDFIGCGNNGSGLGSGEGVNNDEWGETYEAEAEVNGCSGEDCASVVVLAALVVWAALAV